MKKQPPGWDRPVSYPRFIYESTFYYGGWWKLILLHLPGLERYSSGGWTIYGPSWLTRNLEEAHWWHLFSFGKDPNGNWEFQGTAVE